MMAMTTNSSIRVNPACFPFIFLMAIRPVLRFQWGTRPYAINLRRALLKVERNLNKEREEA